MTLIPVQLGDDDLGVLKEQAADDLCQGEQELIERDRDEVDQDHRLRLREFGRNRCSDWTPSCRCCTSGTRAEEGQSRCPIRSTF